MFKERARNYRLQVMPDGAVGQTTFNRDLRPGHNRVTVADRACEILESLGLEAETLDQMQAMVYLVGTLDRKNVTLPALEEAGFPPWLVIGVRRVHGEDWDTTYSYYRALMKDFDEFKLVRGALAVAEVESAPERWQRKVQGDARHWVMQMLLTAPVHGALLRGLLEERLRGE